MGTNFPLHSTGERGWNNGFANLWRKENWSWWRKRQWLWQSISWLVLFNGTITVVLLSPIVQKWSVPGSAQVAVNNVLQTFFNIQFSCIPLGVIGLLQGAIINERQSGTAAWVLSKPVMRSAFILAKIAPVPGLILFSIILPDGIAYLEMRVLLGAVPPASICLTGAGLMICTLLLFFSLMLLAGTIFKNRVMVIGVPFLILIFSLRFLVQTLLLPRLANGDWPFSLLVMLVMLVCALVFLMLAGWIFAQEEF